jgi:hypothetical protein
MALGARTSATGAPGSSPTPVDATLTRAEIELLRAFDGPRSIGDVLALSSFGDLETLTAFASLVERQRLLPAAEVGDAPPLAPDNAISLRPALVSLLALAPGASQARSNAKRARIGLLLAGGLLAWASARWLLQGSVRDDVTARDVQVLTPAPALGVREASSELPRPGALAGAAHVPAIEAAAVASEPAVPTAALDPLVAAAPEPPSPPPPAARPRQASSPRNSAARVRAVRPPAVAASLAPSEPPRTPRMQIIEDRSPSMRVLE